MKSLVRRVISSRHLISNDHVSLTAYWIWSGGLWVVIRSSRLGGSTIAIWQKGCWNGRKTIIRNQTNKKPKYLQIHLLIISCIQFIFFIDYTVYYFTVVEIVFMPSSRSRWRNWCKYFLRQFRIILFIQYRVFWINFRMEW